LKPVTVKTAVVKTFDLIQSRDGPPQYRLPSFFETMPSHPTTTCCLERLAAA
jgi:hypothetical protein